MQDTTREGHFPGQSVGLLATVQRHVPGADTVAVALGDFDHVAGQQAQAVEPSRIGDAGHPRVPQSERSKVVSISRRLVLSPHEGAPVIGNLSAGTSVMVEGVVRALDVRNGAPWLTVGFDGLDVIVEGPSSAVTALSE